MAYRTLAGLIQDETAKYVEWNWQISGATVFPSVAAAALTASASLVGAVQVHGQSEGDDLAMNFEMWRRTANTDYLTLSAAWAGYFLHANGYLANAQDGGALGGLSYGDGVIQDSTFGDFFGLGGDHTYGWGLVEYATYSGSATHLNRAKAIADVILTRTDNSGFGFGSASTTPGGTTPSNLWNTVGQAPPRRAGRVLQLFASLAAAGAGATYTTARNKQLAIIMETIDWNNTYKCWFHNDQDTDAHFSQYGATYAEGVRYISSFQPAIVIEGLRRVLETATFPITFSSFTYTAQNVKDKIIDVASFYYTYGLHPVRRYCGSDIAVGIPGYPNGFFTHFDEGISQEQMDPFYTFSAINALMLGAKYRHEANPNDPLVALYKARAKLHWNQASKGVAVVRADLGRDIVWGNGTSTLGDDRLCFDSEIGRYMGATTQGSGTSDRHFIFAGNDIQHADLLFATPTFGIGDWTEHAGTDMLSQAPPYDGDNTSCIAGHTIGINGFVGGFYANSGAFYDSTRDEYGVWGGGHAAYSGNEVYTFSLDTNTWTRRSSPRAAFARQGIGVGDNQDEDPHGVETVPTARHTGNNMCYVPTDKNGAVVRKMVTMGGYGLWFAGGGAKTCWSWTTVTGAWVRLADADVGTNQYTLTAFYAGFIFYIGANANDNTKDGLWRYDYAANTHTQMDATAAADLDYLGAITIDTRRGHLYYTRPQASQLRRWDLTNFTTNPSPLTITGPTDQLYFAANPGFVYDTVFDRIVIYQGYGQTLHLLNPETLVITAVTGTGADPDNFHGEQGNPYVHTRWQRTNAGTYLIHNWPSKNVFEYTPSSDDIVPPPPPPADDADFISFTGVPTTTTPGATFTPTLTFTNTGTSTWDTVTYKIRSVSPNDNTTWGPAVIALASPIAPAGTLVSNTTQFTAPGSSGMYSFAWQMAVGVSPASGADTFTRANAADLNASVDWTALVGQIKLASNRAENVTTGLAECAYRFNTDLLTNDTFAQVLVDSSGNSQPTALGLFLRHDGTATRTYYYFEIRYDNSGAAIWRCNAGSYVMLAGYTSVTLTPGTPQLLRAEITGQDLSLSLGGSVVLTHTANSSPITTGRYVGLRGFSGHQVYWDDFACGGTAATITRFGEVGSQSVTVTQTGGTQVIPFRRGWGHA